MRIELVSLFSGLALGIAGTLAVAGSVSWFFGPPKIEPKLTDAACIQFVAHRNDILKTNPRAEVDEIPNTCAAYLAKQAINSLRIIVSPSVKEGCFQELTGKNATNSIESVKVDFAVCQAWLEQRK